MPKRGYPKVYIRKHYLLLSGNDLLGFCNGLYGALSGSPLVPVPIVTLLIFQGQIAVLAGILSARVTDKSVGLTQDQINAETVLIDSCDAYADQIYYLANSATPGDIATITSAIVGFGFQIKDPAARQDQTFEVIATNHAQATVTHPVPLENKRGAIYVTSYTATPSDPTSWSAPFFAIESKVTLVDLEPDKRGYFRRAVILPQGLKPVHHVNDPAFNWEPDIISAIIP